MTISYKKIMDNLNNHTELVTIIDEINRLLPQLAGFITQFNQVVINTGVNVITDGTGNLSMDAPGDMSKLEMDRVSTKVGIIDRLINNSGNTINDLFQKGFYIEESLKRSDPSYNSQLVEQVQKFKELNGSYKH